MRSQPHSVSMSSEPRFKGMSSEPDAASMWATLTRVCAQLLLGFTRRVENHRPCMIFKVGSTHDPCAYQLKLLS